MTFPFGIYDTNKCGLAYIGLHENEADCWRIFLGWPDDAEIASAKKSGLVCLPLTITYDPPH